MRDMIRKNLYTAPTAGLLEDYLQVNLVLIPKEYAEDFEAFARLNPKACPIIEISDQDLNFKKIGPVDVIRDVPRYDMIENGQVKEVLLDLSQEDLDNYIAFAIGCSFTFEFALMNHGIGLRHIDEKKNVAMYNTCIPCVSSNLFSGNVVVSMRPIKKKDIDKVVEITSDYSQTHGIPIHVGDPSHIGIDDIMIPDYGDQIEILDDELPVFWACGVTAQKILRASIMRKFYTHTPGHMLITHLPIDSVKSFDPIESISGILKRKTHQRKTSGITYLNDIERFANELIKHDHISLITGFGIDASGTGETDGPMSMFLVRALEKLGIHVDIISDEYTIKQLNVLKQYLNIQAEVHDVKVYNKQTGGCILAIERPGQNQDGDYHTMRGKHIECVTDSDALIAALMQEGMPLFAIGDGGNEVGMGKVSHYIREHVPNGDHIVSKLIADELLVAGVSNWGAYCLTGVLSILSNEKLLQTIEEEVEALRLIVSVGAVDGVTGLNEMTVDGYSLEVNNKVLLDLHNILNRYFRNFQS